MANKYSLAIQALWELKWQARIAKRWLRLLGLTRDLAGFKNPSEKHLLYLKKWLSKLKEVKQEFTEQQKQITKHSDMCKVITELAKKLNTPIPDLKEETVLSSIDFFKEQNKCKNFALTNAI